MFKNDFRLVIDTAEILRLLQALQTTDEFNVSTPVCWQPGEPVMVPAPATYEQLVQRENNPTGSGLECKDWYWCYKTIETQK